MYVLFSVVYQGREVDDAGMVTVYAGNDGAGAGAGNVGGCSALGDSGVYRN